MASRRFNPRNINPTDTLAQQIVRGIIDSQGPFMDLLVNRLGSLIPQIIVGPSDITTERDIIRSAVSAIPVVAINAQQGKLMSLLNGIYECVKAISENKTPAQSTPKIPASPGLAAVTAFLGALMSPKRVIRNIGTINQQLSAFNDVLRSIEEWDVTKAKDVITGAQEAVTEVIKLLEQTSALKPTRVLTAHIGVSIMMRLINNLASYKVPDTINLADYKKLIDLAGALKDIYTNLRAIPTKALVLAPMIRPLLYTIDGLGKIAAALQSIKVLKGAQNNAAALSVIAPEITAIIESLSKIHTARIRNINIIIANILALKDIAQAMSDLHINTQNIGDLRVLMVALGRVQKISSIIIRLGLQAKVANMIMPAVQAYLMGLVKVSDLLNVLSKKLDGDKNVLLKYKQLQLILGSLGMIGLATMLLAVMAPMVLLALPLVAGMLLGLIGLQMAVVAFGMVSLTFQAPLQAAMQGFISVGMAIGALMLTALALYTLSKITLDRQAIEKNVKTILSTALDVILWTLAPVDELTGFTAKPDGSISNTLSMGAKMIGGALIKGAGALLAVPILAGAALATLSMALVGGLLWMIQEIPLDRQQVHRKVRMILGTAEDILGWIFAPVSIPTSRDEYGMEPSATRILGRGLGRLIGTLLGAGAIVMTLISTIAVTAMAGLLWGITKIPLNKGAVENKVSTILSLGDYLTKAILDPKGHIKKSNESNSFLGFLGYMFKGVGGVIESVLGLASVIMMMVSAGAVLLIAGALRGIQAISLNKKKIDDNLDTILGCAGHINEAIYTSKEPQTRKSGQGAMMSIVRWISPELGGLLQSIFSLAYLATVMISAAVVNIVAVELKGIASLKIDKGALDTNLATIQAGVASINGMIYNPKEPDAQGSSMGWGMKLIKWISPEMGGLLESLMSLAYLATVMISVSVVKIIAKNIASIGNIDSGALNKGITQAQAALGSGVSLVNMVFNENLFKEPINQNGSGVFKKVLKFIAPGLVSIIDGLFTIGKLGLIVLSVHMVKYIADSLGSISKYKADPQAGARARAVVAAGIRVVQAVMGMDIDLSVRQLGKIANKLKGMADVIGAIPAMGKVLLAVNQPQAAVQVGWIRALYILKAARSIVNQARPIAYAKTPYAFFRGKLDSLAEMLDSLNEVGTTMEGIKAISAGTLEKVTGNIAAIKTSLGNNTLAGLQEQMALMSRLNKIYSETDAVMGSVSKVSNSILAVPDITGIIENRKASVNGLCSLIKAISALDIDVAHSNKILDLIDRLNTTTGAFAHVTGQDVKNSGDLIDNYIRFIDRVDKANIERLQTTERLVGFWASISQDINGNFQGLAKTLHEHIMPTLKVLNATMDEVNKTQKSIIDELTKPVQIDTGGGSQGSMIDLSSGGSSTPAMSSGGSGAMGGAAPVPQQNVPQRANKSSENQNDRKIQEILKKVGSIQVDEKGYIITSKKQAH